MIGFAFLMILIFSSCILPEMDAECETSWDCKRCLKESGCGYCDDNNNDETGRCIPGSILGADNPDDCPDQLWRYNDCSEAPRALGCGVYGSFHCSMAERCKWCDVAEICVHDGDSCPSEGDRPCRGMNCSVCLAEDGCAWCEDDSDYYEDHCSANICDFGYKAYYTTCP